MNVSQHLGRLKSLGYDCETADYILAQYQEPHRHYHNLGHIESIISLIDKEDSLADAEKRPLYEAAYWHDVCYPNKPSSPCLFEAMSLCEYVKRCKVHDIVTISAIVATAFHAEDQVGHCRPVQFFLDFDLASFALPWERCWEDSENVRKELCQVYEEKKFIAGNVAFLGQLLARKSIYYVKSEWDKVARSNIARIIEIRSQSLVSMESF